MRSRLIGAAAAAALTSSLAVTTATPAHAAGWGTISSASVNRYLSYTEHNNLGRPFNTSSNVSYRFCVVGRGTGQVNLQPTAFSTTYTFNSSTNVTRCSKAHSGRANRFQPDAVIWSRSTKVYITKVYVQRWYSGPVAV